MGSSVDELASGDGSLRSLAAPGRRGFGRCFVPEVFPDLAIAALGALHNSNAHHLIDGLSPPQLLYSACF